MFRSEPDHLIVACNDLESGVRWVTERLGVEPQPGGRHAVMGTHNALLRLGRRCYLEVIAIDREAPAPMRPRWFGLDDGVTQATLAQSPALITWAVRCDSLAAACARVPELGEILSMSRGPLRWKISVPDDGSLPWGGVLPTALQWESGEVADDDEADAPGHPCEMLEDRGCELVRLDLSHPAAVLGTQGIVSRFRELRILGPVELKPGPRELAATIRTPRGEVVL